MNARRAAAVVAACAALSGCALGPVRSPDPDLPRRLADAVSIETLDTHLRALQDIADAHGGNRAGGTPGYDASVDYVVKVLRDNGFEVQTPEYEVFAGAEGGRPRLTVNGRDHRVDQASLMITTPPGGVSAVTLRPAQAAGCRSADYGSVSVRGAIAIVDDTGCSVVDKHQAAVDRGAVGLLVVNTADSGSRPGLFPPGYYRQLRIPVGVIDRDTSAALRRTTAPVRLVLDNRPVMKKSRNVLAQTKTGSTENVVMIGAHLDSSAAGPGINDNGSGVAALLDIAAALGPRPRVANAVRFAFWGAEENSVQGSTQYLRGLSSQQRQDIALYLNLDMIGSPNAGYFTYDGDQSGRLNPDIPVDAVPDGSAGIERTLSGYLNSAGVRPADMPLSRFTDYYAFLRSGIPVGGLTAGANQLKTEAQARLWGGRPGLPFDPNDHTPRDGIDNIDRDALTVLTRAGAFTVGTYAYSIDGVNGVPARDQRQRTAP